METECSHANHRLRMKNRFERDGIYSFEDHEILEMMLYSLIPRKNTNDIAHDLLKSFGDIPSVLAAAPEALTQVEGIGACTAAGIRFTAELFSYVSDCLFASLTVNDGETAGVYATLKLRFAPKDSAAVSFTDERGAILHSELLYKGEGQVVEELPEYIAHRAKALGAVGVILMHNHKGEPCEASVDDIIITDNIRCTCGAVGINKVMHVIVSDDGYVNI